MQYNDYNFGIDVWIIAVAHDLVYESVLVFNQGFNELI